MIHAFGDQRPSIDATVFIAPNATVIGDVTIEAGASIWFGAVVRGDVGEVKIGAHSNVQDGCVFHVPWGGRIRIGDDVTIGHRALIHGCSVGNRVLVGMGAIIMDGAQIGDESIIGAGAIVTEGIDIPKRSLVLGAPAKVRRELRDDEVEELKLSAARYAEKAAVYRAMDDMQGDPSR